MERTQEILEARVRNTPLEERLKDCQKRIGNMCAELRGPKMSIPVEHYDDDFYINTTLADAQATVEALQRERDEANLYRDQARANQESLAACVDRDVRKIKDLQAALDAERERYELLNVERNAIDDKRHVLLEQLANTIEAAAQQEGELAETQALVANLKSHLSALQALVRALPVPEEGGFPIVEVDGDYYVNHTSRFSTKAEADAYTGLLIYRATLDATTPAGGGQDEK